MFAQRPTALLALALLNAACTPATRNLSDSASQPPLTASEVAGSTFSRNLLTEQELKRAGALTIDEGVRRLRPEFLHPSPRTIAAGTEEPSVYLDGAFFGAVDALRSIPIEQVREIRFITSSRARDFWGALCPCDGGVIHVQTKRVRS